LRSDLTQGLKKSLFAYFDVSQVARYSVIFSVGQIAM